MIGLLKALGATNSQIRHIFIYIAERLVLKGILIGNVIALSLILIQANYHIIPLDPNAYYAVIEAMKMETEITAEFGGKVTGVLVAAKDVVEADQTIIRMDVEK